MSSTPTLPSAAAAQQARVCVRPGESFPLGAVPNGRGLHELDPDGRRVRDATFLLLFNAHHEALDFTLPPASFGETWNVVLDTTAEIGDRDGRFAAGSSMHVEGRSIVVLSRP